MEKEEKEALLKELAKKILRHCQKNKIKEFVAILIYKGAIYMGTDILQYFYEIAPEIDVQDEGFIARAYDEDNQPLENLQILYDLSVDIRGKNVVIIEDFADRVKTIQSIIKNIKNRYPKTLLTITVFGNKEYCQEFEKEENVIIGKTFEKRGRWVVGAGLDENGKRRNWPFAALRIKNNLKVA